MKKAVSLLLSVSFIFSALGFSPVFSEESGREIYLFKEDFSEYNVEKNTNFRDYPSEGKSDVNLGFGFAGKWSPERDEISDFLEVYPKINTLYNGSMYGRLGDTAYRNLAEPIVFDKDIELDLKFKMRCASPADFCGMEFGRNGVKAGITGSGNAFIAACGKEIWGSSVTEYSALNSYEVHIMVKQNGEDIITLSVYDEAGEKAGQAELACELENTVIDNIGVIFNSTPMYVTDISASYEARLEDMLNAQTEIDISQYYNCRIYGTTDTSVLHNPNVVTGPNEGFEVNAFKNLEGWQKEWDGDYNTYVLDGTKYMLKVKEGLTDCSYRTMADDRAVDVFDVKNAGYKELCLLVNTDNTFYSSGIAYLGVILEYTDGTREFVKNRIYNGSEDRGSEQNQIAGLKISANERIVGGELYIHELKIPIDSKKTLDKIEFLNSYAVLNDDENDVAGFEVTDETKQTYRATIYAATLKQTLSSFKEETEKETAACLKSLPSQGVSGEDVLYYIDTVEKIDELINKSEGLEIAFSEFENYNTYVALKQLEESVDVSDISIYVSPEGDDINSGRESAPLKTARKALEKVKRIRKRYKDIAVSVYFGGGEYYIDDTIVLDEGISGDEKNPATFSAIKGEEPVFTGAVSLEAKDFFKVTDENIL